MMVKAVVDLKSLEEIHHRTAKVTDLNFPK
jgi:hypothetical protein